jgi:zinc protease
VTAGSRTNRGRTLGAALLLALGVSTPALARATEAPPAPSLERMVLPNGLTVVLATDHAVPVVGMQLCYQVGSRDEPDARPGLAALVPRLMVRATTHLAEGQYDRALDAAGATGSTWRVEPDRTCFKTTVPAAEVALPLWLWSDQMGFLSGRLDQRLIDQQIVTVKNEQVQRIENTPLGHLTDIESARIYPAGHPYRASPLPDGERLRGIGVPEVRAFVVAQYTPDRATLVLSGDFHTARAIDLVQRYFGTIPRGPGTPRRAAAPPVLFGQTRLHLAARVEQQSVTLVWPTVPFYQPGDAELDLVSELLTGSRAGLLRIKLVNVLGIASSVTSRQYSRQLGSLFVIHATAAPGHTPEELVAATDDLLRSVQGAGPNGYVLAGSIAGYLMGRLFALEDHAARAERYARCEEGGILSSCIETWTRSYTQVDAARIAATVARELPLDRRLIIEAVPTADAPIAGEVRP